MAFMILALIFEVIVLILSVIGYAKLSNPGTYFTLTALSFLIGVFLVLAIIIYAASYDDNPGVGYTNYNYNVGPVGVGVAGFGAFTTFSLGYSFWLAAVALILIAIAFIVGIVTAIRVKREVVC
uniref:NADH dehydrogenase subunit 6 n=1 Tax=Acrobeloides nanus TaxID=290746 RepID=A0A914DGA3_9BILA